MNAAGGKAVKSRPKQSFTGGKTLASCRSALVSFHMSAVPLDLSVMMFARFCRSLALAYKIFSEASLKSCASCVMGSPWSSKTEYSRLAFIKTIDLKGRGFLSSGGLKLLSNTRVTTIAADWEKQQTQSYGPFFSMYSRSQLAVCRIASTLVRSSTHVYAVLKILFRLRGSSEGMGALTKSKVNDLSNFERNCPEEHVSLTRQSRFPQAGVSTCLCLEDEGTCGMPMKHKSVHGSNGDAGA